MSAIIASAETSSRETVAAMYHVGFSFSNLRWTRLSWWMMPSLRVTKGVLAWQTNLQQCPVSRPTTRLVALVVVVGVA